MGTRPLLTLKYCNEMLQAMHTTASSLHQEAYASSTSECEGVALPSVKAVCNCHGGCRYLVITIIRNEIYNKLWLIRYSDLPLSEDTGALDFSSFDRQQRNRTSRTPLPVMKLIDDFRASYTVLYSDGEIFTFSSTYNSTATRCRGQLQLCTCCMHSYLIK